MGDSENAQQPSKKRGALNQLSRENPGLDDDEDSAGLESGTFKKASEEVLASRRIVKVKRKEPSATQATAPNPFASIQLVPATAPAPTTVGTNATLTPAEAVVEGDQKAIDNEEDDEVDSKKVDLKVKDTAVEETKNEDDANQCGKTSDEKVTDSDVNQTISNAVEGTDQTEDPLKKDSGENEEADKNGDNSGALSSFQQHSSSKNAFTGLASTEASGSPFSFPSSGSGSTFGFGFPNNNNSSLIGSPIIKKTEVNSAFPPKQEVSTETGEENEKVAFSADSVMFEYLDGGWKERGKGEVKVNVSSNGGKARLVMRAKGNYRLILNASLYPEMKLASMDKKGITFACMNSVSEGKEGLSTFALKFKDPTIVEEFRVAIDKHKDIKPTEAAAPPLKTPENSPSAADA